MTFKIKLVFSEWDETGSKYVHLSFLLIMFVEH